MPPEQTIQKIDTIRNDIENVVNRRLISLLPLTGFGLGMMMWLIDAAVDSFIIHPDEEFWKAVFTAETTEMWMRTLVVIIFTISSIIVQHYLKKRVQYEMLLLEYQNHLEKMVAERTSELQEMADHDDLTRIYNRRKFSELYEYEIDRAQRYQHPLTLIMIDIDHFKNVNDQYGHNEGDRVLKDFTDFLGMKLRQSDIFARWGGEEFILLLPDTDLKTAEIVAEKLRRLISSRNYGNDIPITASFGISQLRGDEKMLSLLKRADDALYQAKQNGRNRIFTGHYSKNPS